MDSSRSSDSDGASTTYNPPDALTVISWASIGLGALASLWIAWDIVRRSRWRHMMAIISDSRIPVYVINALYLWPITVWIYIRYGRQGMSGNNEEEAAETVEENPLLHAPSHSDHGEESTDREQQHPDGDSIAHHHHDADSGGDVADTHDDDGAGHGEEAHHHHHKHHEHAHMHADLPMFATVTIATCHCGAGCVLGDLVGEWLIYAFEVTIGGRMLYAAFIVDFALALAFGIVFQYLSIAPMAGEYGWRTVVRAAKADFLSLAFFEIGLFGWMAVFDLVIFEQGLGMTTAAYWFMMQVGMFFGHWTGFPINWWLIKEGIKEPCASLKTWLLSKKPEGETNRDALSATSELRTSSPAEEAPSSPQGKGCAPPLAFYLCNGFVNIRGMLGAIANNCSKQALDRLCYQIPLVSMFAVIVSVEHVRIHHSEVPKRDDELQFLSQSWATAASMAG
ncbi:hypothetical protein AYL99_07967 [Fonsecaea erecta]|uniref:DUF4396 domain-containing protein n=1 Tax=Fonsecaea erecta TaxID=1367422 RepID=A0A178ZBT4_9EURO|nr:hypothetical protein AYL99_07967 [Fonsecaea erecta]OAP57229.1 hypothetical protein AYL99_07967 [Fonsecaea erecta]